MVFEGLKGSRRPNNPIGMKYGQLDTRKNLSDTNERSVTNKHRCCHTPLIAVSVVTEKTSCTLPSMDVMVHGFRDKSHATLI